MRTSECVVEDELNGRVRMNVPPPRLESGAAPGYDAIPLEVPNPFEVMELFKRHRFTNVVLRWYALSPRDAVLSSAIANQFRQAAIKLEGEPSGWRGMFLCSAFVVEARKAS